VDSAIVCFAPRAAVPTAPVLTHAVWIDGTEFTWSKKEIAAASKGITEFCGTEGARPSGAAGNTNRKGYSRPVVSGFSVNVIANPVRVAPIPKVIAHVPTNIIITTSGVGL
jgi:hypothetical protein